MNSSYTLAAQWFCLAVKAGNLSRAAKLAGISAPSMSRSLLRLETGIGLKLVHRSAREFRLTSDGEQYFAALSPIFEHLDEQFEGLQARGGELSGTIRMSCPESLVTSLINDWLCQFMTRHPKVKVNLVFALTEDHFTQDRLDIAITVRPPSRGDVVRARLMSTDMWLAASPGFVKANGQPQVAEDLLQFHLLCADLRERWEFIRDGKNLILHPDARYCSSSMQCLIDGAARGLGICNAPKALVEAKVKAGKLIRLLGTEKVHQTHIYLVLADRKLIPKRVRSLVEFLHTKAAGL